MGRHEQPITNCGPAAAFATELRAARRQAGGPSYRQMEKQVRWSDSGLSRAARGDTLPTWDCTRAYLRGCGIVDQADLAVWRRKWLDTKAQMNDASQRADHQEV